MAAERAIPISQVVVDDEATEALVLEVLRSGHLAQGPMVSRLEESFAQLVGVDQAIAVTSGTTALVLAVEAVGVSPGDEVVTSAFTFAATLNAILEAGATARFADVSLDDFCVTGEHIEAVTSDRSRALMPVHLYGQTAEMGTIAEIAERDGLALVEDAAQAHGATFAGRPAGSFGVGCFSLYATKNVTTGEGGIVTTSDAALAERMRILRNQGMRARYEYVVPGHNYRLTDLQAAVGVAQMASLPAWTEQRRANAAALTAAVSGVPGIAVPRELPQRRHVWHQYTVRVLPEARLTRDDLVTALQERGIGCGVYYPRVVFDYECYRSHPRVVVDEVPNARRAAAEVLSLPVHPRVSPSEIERIAETISDLLAQ